MPIFVFADIDNILLSNTDSDNSFRPLGYCVNSVIQRTGAITLDTGEGYPLSSVIDTTNGFAYFGTSTIPGKIIKVRLSDFTKISTLTLDTGENNLNSAVIDTANGFAYFGVTDTANKIIKIRLSDFTKVSTIILSRHYIKSLVIDTINGYIYVGLDGDVWPEVIKIRISDFTEVGWIELIGQGGISRYATIDTINNFAYFYTTSLIKVSKINLSTFTVIGSVKSPSSQLGAVVINTNTGYAYWAEDSSALVHKLNLSTFIFDSSITATGGSFWSAAIDTMNEFAYFGSASNIIARVNLKTFTSSGSVTTLGDEVLFRTAVIDTLNQKAYFATFQNPSKIVKLNLCND